MLLLILINKLYAGVVRSTSMKTEQNRCVTVRSRTGLRMQESWFWAWTWVHRKTHEEVFWLLTRTLTKFK